MALDKNEKHIVVEKEIHKAVKVQAANFGEYGIHMKELVGEWSKLHKFIEMKADRLNIPIKDMYDLVYGFLNSK